MQQSANGKRKRERKRERKGGEEEEDDDEKFARGAKGRRRTYTYGAKYDTGTSAVRCGVPREWGIGWTCSTRPVSTRLSQPVVE